MRAPALCPARPRLPPAVLPTCTVPGQGAHTAACLAPQDAVGRVLWLFPPRSPSEPVGGQTPPILS